MKEQTKDTATTSTFSEAEMNDMHRNAWLNFHADAQEAKQEVNRRYAKMVNTFGSYKKMPDGVKEILKQDYAGHEAKWGDNGTEQQKRFGVKEQEEPQLEYKSLVEEKEQQEKYQQLEQQANNTPQHRHADPTVARPEFVKRTQHVRSLQQTHNIEIER